MHVSRPQIVVAKPALADRSTVRYALHPTRPIAGYLSSESMFARYDVDLTHVPEAILLVPLLATVAPIAWVLGAELRVPTVDTTFLASLEHVRRALARLYPAVDWGGDVRPETVVDCRATYACGRNALLFSGGVDSLASFVLHRHERPLLVSVWGADIGLGYRRRWEQVVDGNRAFAHRRSLDVALVTTNFRTFFNHHRLCARFFGASRNWYSAVQQGLGLAGLCAPLAHVHGLGRVLVPSTHTAASDEPWGSHPTIEDHVRWASTEVAHDGYHLGRQMKLGLLARYVREEDPGLQLRVCWGRGANCSRCTKCSLTMIGLALEGLDPNRHGFRCDAATLARIRTQLERGRMPLSDFAVTLWTEIQGRIATRKRCELDGLDALLAWLEGAPLRRCQARHERRARTRLRRYLETRPEPVGRWVRRALGHPFP